MDHQAAVTGLVTKAQSRVVFALQHFIVMPKPGLAEQPVSVKKAVVRAKGQTPFSNRLYPDHYPLKSAGSCRNPTERYNEKTRQKAGFTGVPEILVAFAGT